MRPSGHLHSTSIGLAFLFTVIHSFTIINGVLFLSGSLLLDGDFFVSKKIFNIPNHREFITHAIVLYIMLSIVCYIIHLDLIWLFLGAFYHLCFDLFDWGLPILPFKITTYVTPHLLTIPSNLDEIYFFKTYFSNKAILISELMLIIGFICSLFFLPIEMITLIIVIELLVIIEFMFQYTRLKRVIVK